MVQNGKIDPLADDMEQCVIVISQIEMDRAKHMKSLEVML